MPAVIPCRDRITRSSLVQVWCNALTSTRDCYSLSAIGPGGKSILVARADCIGCLVAGTDGCHISRARGNVVESGVEVV